MRIADPRGASRSAFVALPDRLAVFVGAEQRGEPLAPRQDRHPDRGSLRGPLAVGARLLAVEARDRAEMRAALRCGRLGGTLFEIIGRARIFLFTNRWILASSQRASL